MRLAFLFLALVVAIPGAFAYLLRADLRPPMRFAVALSLPFALTEPLFYPEYWRPAFLFDLADRIGFGIEDLLFVAALAAVSLASFPVAARRTFVPVEGARRDRWHVARRLLGPCGVAALATGGLVLAGLPAIYAAPIAMVLAAARVAWARPDLVGPAVGGAAATTVVYHLACLSLAVASPQVFHTVWRTRELTGVFVLGVPLEELLYGAASGLAASSIVPYSRGDRLVRASESPGTHRAARVPSR